MIKKVGKSSNGWIRFEIDCCICRAIIQKTTKTFDGVVESLKKDDWWCNKAKNGSTPLKRKDNFCGKCWGIRYHIIKKHPDVNCDDKINELIKQKIFDDNMPDIPSEPAQLNIPKLSEEMVKRAAKVFNPIDDEEPVYRFFNDRCFKKISDDEWVEETN